MGSPHHRNWNSSTSGPADSQITPARSRYNRHAMASSPLTGSFQILFLYDVCEEIHTEQLRSLIGGERFGDGTERRRDSAGHHPSPEYLRFERPPVVQQLGPMVFKNGG